MKRIILAILLASVTALGFTATAHAQNDDKGKGVKVRKHIKRRVRKHYRRRTHKPATTPPANTNK
jgi:Ni/Co efflux regulator RcnB